ncbi:MAG: carboxypeptidase-like regulatory domain-containing protein [Planctomycetota bacterium]|nr:carboxypeptidase-like regulatory domain-containing protein [Planctomycetota bacterium]
MFRRVPFGRKFEVQIESPDGVSLSEGVRGVCSPGESLVLELPCDRPTLVRGRAVTENGTPWAGAMLLVSTCDDGLDRCSESTVRTDREGHFEFDGLWPEDLREGFVEAETCGTGDPARGRVRVRLPEPVPSARARVVDAGDVVLERPQLLASGRVVDVDGRPARFANVEAVRSEMVVDPDGWERAREIVTHLSTCTDEQGRFELRGDRSGGRLKLHAKNSTAQSLLLRAPVGPDELELRLERTGSVRGRVVVAPPRSVRSLEVELRFESGDHDLSALLESSFSTSLDREGRFVFHNVPSGLWEASVWGDGEGELATIEAIDVRPGQPTLDPRLAAIEIPANFIVLRCIDERGWQALGLRAQVRLAGAPASEPEEIDLQGNLLRIPLESLPAEVWLEGREFLALHLPSVAESGTLELVRAPILCLDLGSNDLDCHWGLSLVLTASEPLGLLPRRLWCNIGLDGVTRTPMPFRGRVDLQLKARVPGLHMSYVEVPVEPSFLFLPHDAPSQSLNVRFDAKALRAAITAERRAHGLFDEEDGR